MIPRTLHASFVLALLLVVACGAQGPTPDPNGTASSVATEGATNGCKIATTRLAAFTGQMADSLVVLRPIVVSETFDSAGMVAAVRHASAVLTSFDGLEDSLLSCNETSELAPRLEVIRADAAATLKEAQSALITDADTQLPAGAHLFALLPDILTLSDDGKTIADRLGLEFQTAEVPAGAAEPIPLASPIASEEPPASTPTPAKLAVKVTKQTSSVQQSGTASVTIKTKKNARCTIDVEYASGSSAAAGLGTKTADGSGKVTWKWTVGGNTTLGTWPIYITCHLKDRSGNVDTKFRVK